MAVAIDYPRKSETPSRKNLAAGDGDCMYWAYVITSSFSNADVSAVYARWGIHSPGSIFLVWWLFSRRVDGRINCSSAAAVRPIVAKAMSDKRWGVSDYERRAAGAHWLGAVC
jgi:hypothetical protein